MSLYVFRENFIHIITQLIIIYHFILNRIKFKILKSEEYRGCNYDVILC